MTGGGLVDPLGRQITYLRLSVTDRCDLRCQYCMPERAAFMPKTGVLTVDELGRIANAFIDLGVRKVRPTGGEQLVRPGVMEIVASLGQRVRDGALEEVTLTTNGTQLARHANALVANGVRRINSSLDTLERARFARIARRDALPVVLEGIDAALGAGLRVRIAGGGLGALAGLTGIGGGVFLSPLPVFSGWADPIRAGGIAACFIVVNSAAGLAGRLAAMPELPQALPLWAGAAIVGAWAGSSLSLRRLAGQAMLRALGLVLALASAAIAL